MMRNSGKLLSILLFTTVWTIAVQQGLKAIKGVTSPYDIDNFRDIASAQSILDGDFPADPAYKGEEIWYNPLMPAAIALTSRLTGYNAERSYVQAGPYLNALGLIAFYITVSHLWNPWIALIASASLILAPPYNEIPWATPTYSPWLFAANFAPLFFYCGLVTLTVAVKRQTLFSWLVAGMTLGITFMAHTAPALILGVCGLVAIATMRGVAKPSNSLGIGRLTATAAFILTAFIVSLPLLQSILFHYHLNNRHAAPNNWSWEATHIDHLSSLLRASINYKNIMAIIGLIFVTSRIKKSISCRLLFTWLFVAIGLFTYGLLQQKLNFKYLPPLLPNYHAYVYIQAAGHALVACGIWGLIKIASNFLYRFSSPLISNCIILYLSATLATIYVVVFAWLTLPAYLQRNDSHGVREQSLAISAQRKSPNLPAEIRRLTPKGAVILAGPYESIFQVIVANRQAVVMPLEFSNPYVDYQSRVVAQHEMTAALLSQNSEKFFNLAAQYSVSHVLLNADEKSKFDALTKKSIKTEELLRTEGILLLRL